MSIFSDLNQERNELIGPMIFFCQMKILTNINEPSDWMTMPKNWTMCLCSISWRTQTSLRISSTPRLCSDLFNRFTATVNWNFFELVRSENRWKNLFLFFSLTNSLCFAFQKALKTRKKQTKLIISEQRTRYKKKPYHCRILLRRFVQSIEYFVVIWYFSVSDTFPCRSVVLRTLWKDPVDHDDCSSPGCCAWDLLLNE